MGKAARVSARHRLPPRSRLVLPRFSQKRHHCRHGFLAVPLNEARPSRAASFSQSHCAHMVTRKHRAHTLMWPRFEALSCLRLSEEASIADDHAVWSSHPRQGFLATPKAAGEYTQYADGNHEKAGWPRPQFSLARNPQSGPRHRQ